MRMRLEVESSKGGGNVIISLKLILRKIVKFELNF